MSLHQVRDPRIMQEDPADAVHQVKKGPNSAVWTVRQAQNATPQQINFNLPICAAGVGRDRTNLWLQCTGTAVITGAGFDTTGNKLKAGCVGFKPFPLNRNFVVQHIIGNADETINTNQIIDVLENLNLNPIKSNHYANSTPDLYADYTGLFGNNINPLGQYQQSVDGYTYKSRNVGIKNLVVNSATQITIIFDITEPLITPFTFMDTDNEPALFNVPSEQIIITSPKGMNDMFAFIPSQMGDDAEVNEVEISDFKANLEICYLSMDPKDVSENASITFPSYTYQSANAEVDKNASITVNYQTIPSKVIYCVRPLYNQRVNLDGRSSLPDRFLTLEQPQVSINNLPSALNGASKTQMWAISKRNGYCGNLEHWDGRKLDYGTGAIVGAGSVLVLDPSYDLGLASSQLSNDFAANYTLTGSFLPSDSLTQTGNTAQLPTLELACILVTKKELIRSGNDYLSRPFNITLQDGRNVLDVSEENATPANVVEDNETGGRLHGAGFSDFLHRASRVAQKAFHWGMKNKDKLKELHSKAKELYDDKGGYMMGGYEIGGSARKKSGMKTIKLHKYK